MSDSAIRGIRLAVDAMGGDFGPSEVVPGALDFARSHPQDSVILVGDEAVVRGIVGDLPPNVRIVHASEVIGMDEHPDDDIDPRLAALRGFKPESTD